MSVRVLKPGLLSSLQDLGRLGYQHQGIPAAGAMDARAHRLASLLAGNDPARTASLEITLQGPTLRFERAACFALGGASLGAALNGQPLPVNRPLLARAGDELSFGAPIFAPDETAPGAAPGLRAYLAVHGGFAVPPLMGSESTYLRSGFGGHHGRALAKGDTIELRLHLREDGLDALEDAQWQTRLYLPGTLAARTRATVRAMPGRQWEDFSAAARAAFGQEPFTVTPQSDRMGYRLDGPALGMDTPRQMLSEATCFGTVQVPADGAPIVLMADRQTTGGYPKIAQVASVDLPALAQTAPGSTIRFEMISLEQAQRLDSDRETAFAHLAAALAPLRALYARHTYEPD
ncbi:biotin-dependent carboxyltransferase family protein [Bordetella genomosp. 11]|uniref:Carboxylase n=1 Tax=Bordetella genomosp. 11 TaxID=1416808 RepID=A0A261UL73_9BORD|nr:biotin-dependent carboxyltransferase family protein [Bordetella genomosp. 11]OZI62638.1 carboxylase [Bordetella genomosp. 11]